MREVMEHTAGKVYLAYLAATIVGMVVVIVRGALSVPEGGEPFLLMGWMTAPLVAGVAFVLLWLVGYLVYFFKFWPYR